MAPHIAAMAIGFLVGATCAHLRTRTLVLKGVGIPLIAFLVLAAVDKVDPHPLWLALNRQIATLFLSNFWLSGLLGFGIGLSFWERTPFEGSSAIPLLTPRGKSPRD